MSCVSLDSLTKQQGLHQVPCEEAAPPHRPERCACACGGWSPTSDAGVVWCTLAPIRCDLERTEEGVSSRGPRGRLEVGRSLCWGPWLVLQAGEGSSEWPDRMTGQGEDPSCATSQDLRTQVDDVAVAAARDGEGRCWSPLQRGRVYLPRQLPGSDSPKPHTLSAHLTSHPLGEALFWPTETSWPCGRLHSLRVPGHPRQSRMLIRSLALRH